MIRFRVKQVHAGLSPGLMSLGQSPEGFPLKDLHSPHTCIPQAVQETVQHLEAAHLPMRVIFPRPLTGSAPGST
jgi:hypothetical protein